MPTRKIAEPNNRGYCRDREHNPPSMMVYENGLYEHECPSCGAKQRFRVNKPTFSIGDMMRGENRDHPWPNIRGPMFPVARR